MSNITTVPALVSDLKSSLEDHLKEMKSIADGVQNGLTERDVYSDLKARLLLKYYGIDAEVSNSRDFSPFFGLRRSDNGSV